MKILLIIYQARKRPFSGLASRRLDCPDISDRYLGLGPEKQKMIKQILTLRGLIEAHQNHEEELYGNRAKFVLHEHGQ